MANAAAGPPEVRDALSAGRLGLYDAAEFRLSDVRGADGRSMPFAVTPKIKTNLS